MLEVYFTKILGELFDNKQLELDVDLNVRRNLQQGIEQPFHPGRERCNTS